VLLIHLLESQVLQPLVMGNAVSVHPLAIVFAVAGGSLLAGIAGALFAVPLVATGNAIVTSIASGRWRRGPGEQDPSPGDHGTAPVASVAQKGETPDV
jgi:predicted PurR-regulated permease PerM